MPPDRTGLILAHGRNDVNLIELPQYVERGPCHPVGVSRDSASQAQAEVPLYESQLPRVVENMPKSRPWTTDIRRRQR